MGGDLADTAAERYRFLEPIGQGGMGTVWCAWDVTLGRKVAIKELNLPGQLAGRDRELWYARMAREARAAARLKHPGIVTVHDRVTGPEGLPWIVMEYIAGGSLEDLLREQGRLPVQQVAAIGVQMIEALMAAHAHGIVHRDIKPANVLLESGRAVLTDFGIAVLDGDVSLTQPGTLLGTPAFMAPEQVHGYPATSQSDLWSLGATLYAAVEGERPFTGSVPGAVYAAVATQEPRPPVHAGPLSDVLAGLLRKDPADRMTAEQAHVLLQALAANDPAVWPGAGRAAPVTGPPSSSYLTTGDPVRSTVPGAARGISAKTAAVAAAVAVACLAAGGAAIVLFPGLTGHAAVSTTPTPGSPTPSATPVSLAGHTGMITGLAFDPTGKIVGSASADGSVRLWDAATGKTLHTYASSGFTMQFVAFSPDRRTVAFNGKTQGSLRLRNSVTGATRTISTKGIVGPVISGPATFSPDGKVLAVGNINGTVGLWDPATGGTITVLSRGAGNSLAPKLLFGLAFSPGGKILAVGDGHSVQLWDVAARHVIRTITGVGTGAYETLAFSPDGKTLAGDGSDGGVRLWEVSSGNLTATCSGLQGGMAFSPDGKTVVAGGPGGVAVFWDRATGRTTVLGDQSFSDITYMVAFSPDGRTLATGSARGSLQLWQLR